jgi:hypothetical protein
MTTLRLHISGPNQHIIIKLGIRYSLVVYLNILRSLVQKIEIKIVGFDEMGPLH